RDKILIVATQTWNDARSQKGRFTDARWTENRDDARCAAFAQPTQHVHGFNNLRIAAEVDTCIDIIERLETPIGRTVRLIRRGPRKEARIEAGLCQSVLKAQEALA